VQPKIPIAWLKTSDDVSWKSLDSAVYSGLVGSRVPLQDCVDFLFWKNIGKYQQLKIFLSTNQSKQSVKCRM